MNPGRHQREDYRFNHQRRIVQGYFYLPGRGRVLRKLCSFAEAGLDTNGNPVKDTAREETRRARMYAARYRELERELLDGLDASVTVPTIRAKLDEWRRDSKGQVRETSREVYRVMRNQYLESVGNHPLYLVEPRTRLRRYDVTKANRFRRDLKDRGLSAHTIHKQMRTLRTFLHVMREAGELDTVPRFRMPALPKKLPVTMTDTQVGALFSVIAHHRAATNNPRQRWFCDLHLRALVLALGTGRRVGEFHSRRWEHIDWRRGRLFIGEDESVGFAVKQRQDAWIPLAPTVLGALREWRAAARKRGEVWLMDDGRGNLALGRYAITQAFSRYLTGEPPAGLGLKGKKIKPTHSFRANYITQLFRLGVDLKTIMENVGHRRIETTLGYITEPGELQQMAVNRYDEHLQAVMRRRSLRVLEGGKSSRTVNGLKTRSRRRKGQGRSSATRRTPGG